MHRDRSQESSFQEDEEIDENERKRRQAQKIMDLQPPIGLTDRYSPKGLRYRFYYPEF